MTNREQILSNIGDMMIAERLIALWEIQSGIYLQRKDL